MEKEKEEGCRRTGIKEMLNKDKCIFFRISKRGDSGGRTQVGGQTERERS